MPSQKVWFVTGSARGFGRIWVEAALERGDRVAATARTVGDIEDLATKYGDAVLPLTLDVDDRAAVFAAFKTAHEKFGRIDVVINNAGFGSFGAIEEVTEAQARAQIETNLFGALWVTQAALPIMREQKVATSFRSRASAVSWRFRISVSIMRRSGASRASRRHSHKRSLRSAST